MQEQNLGLIGWWDELSFTGKELFRLDEDGTLTLLPNSNIKERAIAIISDESKDEVLQNLQERFNHVEAKIREMEVEWIAAEDKLKLTDKVNQAKEYINLSPAIGNYLPLAQLVHDWEHTLYSLTEENYAEKVKLTELAESLAQGDEWKDATQALREISEKWKRLATLDKSRSDKLWHRIEAARKLFVERKRVHHEEQEKNMLHNMDLKIDLVEQAEAIAASEDWKKTADTFQRLTDEWKTIGPTVNKKNEELWHRFTLAKKVFFDRKREHSNVVHKELEKNYEIKLELVEKAELVKDSTEWGSTAQTLTKLMEEWKKTGRIHHSKGDDLWKRFIGINDHFFEAKRKHFDEQRSNQEQNYEQKKVLLERAEEIKNSGRWNDTTDEMIELLEDWKKIGPIPRSYGDTLWEEFNAARKHFFDRKNAHREQRKQVVEYQKVAQAKEAKKAVVNLVEEIKEEEDKLADFNNALDNVTPGKKAKELRAHLKNLIVETAERLHQLKQKYARAQKDVSAAPPKKETSAAIAGNEDIKEEKAEDNEEG